MPGDPGENPVDEPGGGAELVGPAAPNLEYRRERLDQVMKSRDRGCLMVIPAALGLAAALAAMRL